MIVRIRTTLCSIAYILLFAISAAAQPITDGDGDIGVGTLLPHGSALLELSSTSKGFLLSRMTTAQRDRIVRPSTGLMIYNLNDSSMQINCGDEDVPVWCPFVVENSHGGLSGHLAPGAIWYGGSDSTAVELSVGAAGSILTSNGSNPSWLPNPGGLLPSGTMNNSTLRWDGVAWVENTNLTSDVAGNTTINGGVVSLPNIPIAIAGTDVLITDGGGNLQTINVNNLIGSTTLTQNALWTGNAANNPSELLSTNVPGAILTQSGTGAPVWSAPAAAQFWLLTGNSGTNPGINFLGTTDAQSLVFRTNNVQRARFDESTGGHFVPGSDNQYNLGSALLRWRDVYVGPGSLHIMSTAAETVTAQDWVLGIEQSGFPTSAKRGNLQILSGGTEVVNVTPSGRVGIGAEFNAGFAQQIDATLSVQGDAIISRTGLTGRQQLLHFSDQTDQPFFLRFLRVNEADFRISEALNDQIRFRTGASSGSPTLFRGGYRFDIVNTTATKSMLYIDSTGLGVNITGTGGDRPLHYLHVRGQRVDDEVAAVYGVVEGVSSNQTVGLWGDARNNTNGNTGSIGVFATGSGSLTPSQTNIALQLSDGEFTMGRTSQPGVAYAVVEGAASGVQYLGQGPSGVIEMTLGAGGNLPSVAPTAGAFQNLGTVTVNNRYVSSTSIVLVNVLSKVDDGAAPNPEDAVFMVDVDNRAAGLFQLRVGMIPTATNGVNFQNGDVVRIGYTVINPAR